MRSLCVWSPIYQEWPKEMERAISYSVHRVGVLNSSCGSTRSYTTRDIIRLFYYDVHKHDNVDEYGGGRRGFAPKEIFFH